MSGITNTKKTMEQNFLAALALGGPGSIEMSERHGQAELVQSTLLPVDMHGEKAAFEKVGFKFGDVVKDDPLFIETTMPAGWKKERTDHAMWSKIVDEKGNERAMVFYKAAFYDRSAHMSLSSRFKIKGPYEGERGQKECTAKVIDLKHDLVLHEVTRSAGPKEYQCADGNAREAAYEWLKENRANYSDPLAWLDD